MVQLFFIFALVTATPSSDIFIFSPTSSTWSQLTMSSAVAVRPLNTDFNDDTLKLNEYADQTIPEVGSA